MEWIEDCKVKDGRQKKLKMEWSREMECEGGQRTVRSKKADKKLEKKCEKIDGQNN